MVGIKFNLFIFALILHLGNQVYILSYSPPKSHFIERIVKLEGRSMHDLFMKTVPKFYKGKRYVMEEKSVGHVNFTYFLESLDALYDSSNLVSTGQTRIAPELLSQSKLQLKTEVAPHINHIKKDFRSNIFFKFLYNPFLYHPGKLATRDFPAMIYLINPSIKPTTIYLIEKEGNLFFLPEEYIHLD